MRSEYIMYITDVTIKISIYNRKFVVFIRTVDRVVGALRYLAVRQLFDPGGNPFYFIFLSYKELENIVYLIL